MKSPRKSPRIDRREFLAATGTGLLAASMPTVAQAESFSGRALAAPSSAAASSAQASSGSLRKIPIGVFDPVYEKLSLDEMLDRVSALGLEAMEIGTGGYPGTGHCPIDELLADAGKRRRGKRSLKTAAFKLPRSVATAIRFIPTKNTRRATSRVFAKRCFSPSDWTSA